MKQVILYKAGPDTCYAELHPAGKDGDVLLKFYTVHEGRRSRSSINHAQFIVSPENLKEFKNML